MNGKCDFCKKSKNIELVMFERRGRILNESMKIIRELARNVMADHDEEEGESPEVTKIKDLIIQARGVVLAESLIGVKE